MKWYEFNDSYVKPIVAGRLESQFGNGSSNQSAYILLYKLKDDSHNVELSDIPEYWKDFVKTQNETYMKEREAYDIEKNNLEIFLQPQILFDIKEGVDIRYIDLKDTEEQGEKIKLSFDTTVAELKTRIRETLAIPEGTSFDGFETCQLGNDLNQIFRSLSEYEDTAIIKSTGITHLSTWLITTEEPTIEYLKTIKGDDMEPIYINYRFKDEENRVVMYRNMYCGDFIQKTAETYGFDNWKQIKVTYFVDGLIRRLDRLKYDVEKQCDHTLKSLSVHDNSQILVEAKTPEEIKIEEENSNLQTDYIDPTKQTTSSTQEIAIDVDETPNIRSVILHKEEDPEFLERFNIDINWTIEELHEKLKQYMGIDEKQERRLRREYDNSLIVKEELGVQLRDYPEFLEGGVRLKMEFGRFPSIEELAVSVSVYGNPEFSLRFYFKKEGTVAEGKETICKEFGLEPHKYKLWRLDIYGEPSYIVKKERQIWEKNHISNGDELIIKSEEDILPDEQVIIDIHETVTGIPNDCKSIGHVICKDADTIDDLKEAILNMEEYRDREDLKTMTTDRIRLRMRGRNLFFGKIYREKNKTLKNLKIKSSTHLVVQFLREPEELKNTEMILLLRKRNLEVRDYLEFIEFKYNHEKALPTVGHLSGKMSEVVEIASENIAIAKYIPHAYDWKYWNPEEDIPIKIKNKNKKGKQKNKKNKNKNNKQNNKNNQNNSENKGDKKNQEVEVKLSDVVKDDDKEEAKQEDKDKDQNQQKSKEAEYEYKKLSTLDLRSTPFFLSEGDILGVRDDSLPGAKEDDFQTEADILNRARLQEVLSNKFEKDKGTHRPANNDPFRIYTDF